MANNDLSHLIGTPVRMSVHPRGVKACELAKLLGFHTVYVMETVGYSAPSDAMELALYDELIIGVEAAIDLGRTTFNEMYLDDLIDQKLAELKKRQLKQLIDSAL